MYLLTDELIFPHPRYANKDGLLAIGGDLRPERLILGYKNGIFPWFSEGQPIMWWSLPERMVLFPDDYKSSKSLRQTIKKNIFKTTFDKDFAGVIKNCADMKRKHEDSTWITPEMQSAYIKLHELGFAHSVETWLDDRLVGGLYGVEIGKIFFGESMFHLESNASKVALYYLVQKMKSKNCIMIDAQMYTNNMHEAGAVMIRRERFLDILKQGIQN